MCFHQFNISWEDSHPIISNSNQIYPIALLDPQNNPPFGWSPISHPSPHNLIPNSSAMIIAAFSPTTSAVEYVFAATFLGQMERSESNIDEYIRSTKELVSGGRTGNFQPINSINVEAFIDNTPVLQRLHGARPYTMK
jgi:hypothetical protein